ncbi:MAG: WD40 repeat domain-containing serine/threonine protein kinase [Myxococcota bacterium]
MSGGTDESASEMGWSDTSNPAAVSGEWGVSTGSSERYERLSVLGSGGMGTVYLAEDHLLRRQVALKVARGGPGGACAVRLQREARIIGGLDHPGIVAIHDYGIDEAGMPWYAMGVARGQTLAKAIGGSDIVADRRRLLRSVLAVCEAVAHAHQRGILHRDLKPSNILVGELGEAVVMDWGLARPIITGDAAWQNVLESGGQTIAGSIVGTPSYMSPEQAAGDVLKPSSDVWALGMCLYQVLVGEPAFKGDDAREVLAQVLHGTVPDVVEVGTLVPPELGAIVRRATAREPAERYPTAAELAADLGAWVNGGRVQAHTYTAVAEVGRALQRYRQAFLVSVVLGAGAAALVSLAWWQAAQQRDNAVDANAAEVEARGLSERHLAAALVAQARAVSSLDARGEAETLAAHALTLSEIPAARGLLLSSAARPERIALMPIPAECLDLVLEPGATAVACRQSESLSIIEVPSAEQRWRVPASLPEVRFTAGGSLFGWPTIGGRMSVFDGKHGGADGATIDWQQDRNVRSKHPTWLARREPSSVVWLDRSDGRIWSEALSSRVHAGVVARDGTLFVATRVGLTRVSVDGERVEWPVKWGAEGPPFSLDTSFDGQKIALGFLEGTIQTHDRDGALLGRRHLAPGMVQFVEWSDNAQRLIAIDERGSPCVLEGPDLSQAIRLPGVVYDAGFQASGDLTLVSNDGVRVWRLLGESTAPSVLEAPGGVSSLDWRADALAASVGPGDLLLWRDRALVDRVHIADGTAAKDVALSPDGTQLLGVSVAPSAVLRAADGTTRDVEWGRRLPALGRAVWLAPDLIIGGARSDGPVVRRLDGPVYGQLQRAGLSVLDAEPNASRSRAAVLATDGGLYRIDAGPEPAIQLLFRLESPRAVALIEGSERLVVATRTRLQLREPDGSVVWSKPTQASLRDVVTSPDGSLIAAGERSGLARIWRTSDGKELAVLSGHTERVQALVFSPDGRTLATGSWDETIRFWNIDRLNTPAEELLREVEQAWGLSLDQALGGS